MSRNEGTPDIIDQAIEEHCKSHTKFCAAEGFATTQMSAHEARGVWDQVRDEAKKRGIGIVQLLTILGPILNMIFAGNPISAIIAQILAILNPQNPTVPGA